MSDSTVSSYIFKRTESEGPFSSSVKRISKLGSIEKESVSRNNINFTSYMYDDESNFCSRQINLGVNFLFIPLAVLITFIFLEYPLINDKLEAYFETKFLLIAFKGIILFLAAYLADRLVYSWRKSHRKPTLR